MHVVTCEITRPLSVYDERAKKCTKKFEAVSVNQNRILDKILEVEAYWNIEPIIWVGDCAYKIQIIEQGIFHVILCQTCIWMSHIVNQRLVRLTFI